jgi:hypothetical protein
MMSELYRGSPSRVDPNASIPGSMTFSTTQWACLTRRIASTKSQDRLPQIRGGNMTILCGALPQMLQTKTSMVAGLQSTESQNQAVGAAGTICLSSTRSPNMVRASGARSTSRILQLSSCLHELQRFPFNSASFQIVPFYNSIQHSDGVLGRCRYIAWLTAYHWAPNAFSTLELHNFFLLVSDHASDALLNETRWKHGRGTFMKNQFSHSRHFIKN